MVLTDGSLTETTDAAPRSFQTELSPVLLTLNCAPVDDGSACCSAPGAPLWTPDYLTSILSALMEAHMWPTDVVPLCIEYVYIRRVVCA